MDVKEPRAPTAEKLSERIRAAIPEDAWPFNHGPEARKWMRDRYVPPTSWLMDAEVLEAEAESLKSAFDRERQEACGLAFDYGRLMEEAAHLWQRVHMERDMGECCDWLNVVPCPLNPYRSPPTGGESK